MLEQMTGQMKRLPSESFKTAMVGRYFSLPKDNRIRILVVDDEICRFDWDKFDCRLCTPELIEDVSYSEDSPRTHRRRRKTCKRR
jgi:hypothetical protein